MKLLTLISCTLLMVTTSFRCEPDPCFQLKLLTINAISGRYCVTEDGEIYTIGDCESVNLEYEVPGSPPLNDISAVLTTWGAVGAGGTIVSDLEDGWAVVNSPTSQDLWSLCFEPGAPVFAVGDSGTILRSTDYYSEKWEPLNSPTDADLYKVECSYWPNSVQIYGEDMTGFRSLDDGETWEEIDFYNPPSRTGQTERSGPPDIYTSYAFNENEGYVFGQYGTFFFTTDGGESWRSGLVPGFNRINTAYFTSVDSGVVAGDRGTIRFTTNGGMSWFQDSLVSTLTQHDIYTIDLREDSVWVMVGDSGTVVFYTPDSTVLSAGTEGGSLPQSFNLYQNYPNPFNPTTIITYGLSENSWVSLKVYNTLGQEVITLVDDHQSAGYQSVLWNGRDNSGSTVASGIYIYRMQAGDFVETKKLLLLK